MIFDISLRWCWNGVEAMHPANIGRMPCHPPLPLSAAGRRSTYRLVLLGLCLGAAGCAAPQAPRYVVGHDTIARPEPAAQHSLIEQVLERQVTPPLDGPVRLLAAPLPGYPAALRRARLEGTVRVRFQVQHDGTVGPAFVVGEIPEPLARIALATIRQWQFAPMARRGQPVSQWFEQPFKFRLTGPAPAAGL